MNNVVVACARHSRRCGWLLRRCRWLAVKQGVDIRFGLQPVGEFISGIEATPHGDEESRFLDHPMDAETNVLGNHLLILVVAFRPVAGLSPGLDLEFVAHPVGIEILAIVNVLPWGMFAFCVVPKLSSGIHVLFR